MVGKKELVAAARKLADTCETIGVEAFFDYENLLEYLEQVGLNCDSSNSTPEEAEQLERFYRAFCKAFEKRRVKCTLDQGVCDAFKEIAGILDFTCWEWHQEHPLVEEFWQDYTCAAHIEDLEELLCKKENTCEIVLRGYTDEYEPYPADLQLTRKERSDRRYLKRSLRNVREGCRAIRAKARVLKNENDVVRVIVAKGWVLDVARS